MSRISEIAKKALVLSELLNPDMVKLETDDIIDKELTMINCDMIESGEDRYPIIIFKECANSYYFGGKVFTNLVDAIINDPSGMDELRKTGLKLKFSYAMNKDKKKYTKVEVIG